ncbi:hypothetical protein [Paenibacillus sp. 2TAF8]|jgi:hypothetical protein|uniref:hypothetical protein n=1 Tax=Paenibacillus sp. 2TAF8 TaxID=3233020 RepID=UPI003F97D368
MTENLWSVVREIKSGTLCLADIQDKAPKNVVTHLNNLFSGKERNTRVMNDIVALKGAWPD